MKKYKKEALENALFINIARLKILTALTTLSVLSGIHIVNTAEKNNLENYYEEIIEEHKQDSVEENDRFLTTYQNDNVLIANLKSSVEKKYKISNNNIIDNNDELITLENCTQDTYFFNNKLSEEILANCRLKDSKITTLAFNGSGVGNYVVNYLPSTVKYLSFKKCSFITDLSTLSDYCPNIEVLDLNIMNLTDLSFIYKLPNLKVLLISDSAAITPELVNYLEKNNIETNIGLLDIAASVHIDNILKEIIKPNMTDEQKIRAITLYVINNIDYDINSISDSNSSPLISTLLNKNGVCTSYAYLTTTLLRKAGIDAFRIINDDHAWTLVNLDGKFYYIDPTNINKNEFYQFILEKFGLAKNYMIDTESTINTSMTKPTDSQTIIPLDLIKDISLGRDKKTLIQKYGHTIINESYYVGGIIAGIFAYLGIIPIILTSAYTVDLNKRIHEDYYDEIQKVYNKNLEQ